MGTVKDTPTVPQPEHPCPACRDQYYHYVKAKPVWWWDGREWICNRCHGNERGEGALLDALAATERGRQPAPAVKPPPRGSWHKKPPRPAASAPAPKAGSASPSKVHRPLPDAKAKFDAIFRELGINRKQ